MTFFDREEKRRLVRAAEKCADATRRASRAEKEYGHCRRCGANLSVIGMHDGGLCPWCSFSWGKKGIGILMGDALLTTHTWGISLGEAIDAKKTLARIEKEPRPGDGDFLIELLMRASYHPGRE